MHAVTQTLSEMAVPVDESKLLMKPNTTLALDVEEATSVLHLIEALEELDDVTNVFHNLELTDDLIAQFA
jgi:transcriptional/translational regulatory protein YebC/TACO1